VVKGSIISLIGCGASGAYGPGPDDEEEGQVYPITYEGTERE
jgi:hypothetical protein